MPKKIQTHKMIPTSERYEQSPERKQRQAFYSQSAWRKLSTAYRKQHPLCECGCGHLSEAVHHREDVAERPDLALSQDNLEALAKRCHDKLTKARQDKARSGE